jgi:uncharacterized damage-inducible protein DinB
MSKQVQKTYRSIQYNVAVYETLLEGITEEHFQRTPAAGGWSYAEVFSHIFRSNMTCINVIALCANGEAVELRKEPSIPIKLVLFFKRFPPGMKFKVPKKLEYMVEKISREQALELITAFNNAITPAMEQALKASHTQRQKHPRMGMLNAKEWFAFIDVHTRHHRRQLGRIKKQLATGY